MACLGTGTPSDSSGGSGGGEVCGREGGGRCVGGRGRRHTKVKTLVSKTLPNKDITFSVLDWRQGPLTMGPLCNYF